MKKVGSKKQTGSGWFGKDRDDLKREQIQKLLNEISKKLNNLTLNNSEKVNKIRTIYTYVYNSLNNNEFKLDLDNTIIELNKYIEILDGELKKSRKSIQLNTSSPLTYGGRSKKKTSSKKK